MKASETVQAAFVRAFFFEALALGFDRQRLTQRSSFDPDAWPNPDARLPHAIYLRLWQAVRDLANDPAFALKLGELVDPQQMGILGSMVLSSPTLRDVGHLFVRYARLLNSLYQVTESEAGGVYTYTYVADCPIELEPGFVELQFAAVLSLCRKLSDVDIIPVALRFRYPKPPYAAKYQRLFRAPLYFDQPHNEILLELNALDLRIAETNRYAHDLLNRHAAMLLSELERADSVGGQVQRYILDTLRTGRSTIESCAAGLNMSRRTLHRKLREEGVSFQDLQDAIRRRLAFEYLSQPHVSTAEVALMLGYSEPSAFHRAFKNWTGATATVYRQTSLAKTPTSLDQNFH